MPVSGVRNVRFFRFKSCLSVWPLWLLLLFIASASRAAQSVSLLAASNHNSTGNSSIVCGGFGQPCCCNQDVLRTKEGSPVRSSCCHSSANFCLFFTYLAARDGSEVENPVIPSLCLAKPQTCGQNNGPCCPHSATGETLTGVCSDPLSTCEYAQPAPPSTGGCLNCFLEDYAVYAQDATVFPSDQYGNCTRHEACPPAHFGKPCGQTLAPGCLPTANDCQPGSWCAPVNNSTLYSYGLTVPTICQAVPGECGKLGGPCCPPRANNRLTTSVPFCYDHNVVCTADTYPSLTVEKLAQSLCQPLLLSPKDCGAIGKSCCPLYYRLTTDKLTPRECVDGSSCGDGSDTPSPVCTLNSQSCGTEGKPCCMISSSNSTVVSSSSGGNRKLNSLGRSLKSATQSQNPCGDGLQCVGSAPDEGTCLS